MEVLTNRTSAPAMAGSPRDRYFEDYVPGSVFEYGAIRLEESDIVAFGKHYAPYQCHISPEKAAQGSFGGLVASEWQIAGIMMRLLADHFLSAVASIVSPGCDEIRFLRPVRPGDLLSIRVTVLRSRRSNSKPEQGVVWDRVELLNQYREVVLTLTTIDMLRCRAAASTSSEGA